MIIPLDEMEYYLLPGNPPPRFAHRHKHNLAYAHYRKIWKRILDRRAGEGIFDPYSFFRQNCIHVIFHKETVVAQIFSSFLNLESEIIHDLSYFQYFKEKGVEALKAEQAKSLMSLEFSSINPDFSPRKVAGICFGEIITYLGSRWAMSLEVDAITGLPRRVTGTNNKVSDSGFRCIESASESRGIGIDVMIGFRKELVDHSSPDMRMIIDTLWNRRQDFVYNNSNQEKSKQQREEKNEFIRDSITI